MCKKKGRLGPGLFLGVVLFTVSFQSTYSWPCQLPARPGPSLRLASLPLSARKKPAAPRRGPFQSVEVKWPLRGKGWTYCVLSCPHEAGPLVLVSEFSSHPPSGPGAPAVTPLRIVQEPQ